jgi:hypothetical protein
LHLSIAHPPIPAFTVRVRLGPGQVMLLVELSLARDDPRPLHTAANDSSHHKYSFAVSRIPVSRAHHEAGTLPILGRPREPIILAEPLQPLEPCLCARLACCDVTTVCDIAAAGRKPAQSNSSLFVMMANP